MAELIPLAYRARVALRRRLETWILGAVLAAAACVALLVSVGAWQARTAARLADLRAEYQRQSALITRSQELHGKRQNLADRMQTIQKLMDDRVLLTLLRNVSESFSPNDCLEYICIDARNGGEEGRFVVRITGITNNSTTLADLMTRLGKNKEPAVTVTLEMSRREPYFDGQVMRFQITCAPGGNKG